MPSSPTQPLRILAVDDSAVDLRWLRTTLERQGHEVVTARDGAEALVRLANTPFDVVVTDGIMPLVDGYELCRLIKDGPSTQDLPVVIHTGDRAPVNKLWARICGADHFLHKSVDPSPLLGLLSSIRPLVRAAPLEPTPPPRAAQAIQTHLARQLQVRLLESALRTAISTLYIHVHEPETLVWSLGETLAEMVLPGGLYVVLPLASGRQGHLLSSPDFPEPFFREVLDGLGEWGRPVAWHHRTLPMPLPQGSLLDHHAFLLSDPGSPAYGWWGVMMPGESLHPTLPLLNLVDDEFQRVYRTLMLLDQLQEANRRLTEADRHKTAFVRTVTHEIRNPLTAATAALDLLLEGPLDAARVQRLGLTARRSLGRLLDLASGVLDLEKIEAGAFRCERVPVDLRQLLLDLQEEYLPLAHERDLALVLDIPESAALVLGDRARLAQCVVNFLSNGLRHGPQGSRLILRLAQACTHWVVSVVDEGEGVPEAFRPQLFQTFRQAEGRRGGGTGLGLAITRALTEQMGGSAGYHPNPIGGAIFTLAFPCHGTPGSPS